MKRLALLILILALAVNAHAFILVGSLGPKPSTTYAPNAPTAGSATPLSQQNTISWTASAVDGTHSAPTQYNLLWGLSAGSEPNTISNITSPYVHSSLTNGTAYYYKVQAYNSAGTANSTEFNATPTTLTPSVPTIGTASAGNASATVAFTAGTVDANHSAATSYTATSSPGSITGTGSSSPITVSGLTNGTGYTFTVTATNSGGTSAASAASNSVTPSAGSGGTTWTFTGSATNSTDWSTWQGGTGSATANASGMYLVNGSTAGNEAGMAYKTSFSLPPGGQTTMWRVKILTPVSVTTGQYVAVTLWEGNALTFPGAQSTTLPTSIRRLITVLNYNAYVGTYTLANGTNVNGGVTINTNSTYYVYFMLTSTQSRIVVTSSAVSDGSISQTFNNVLGDSGVQTIGSSGMTNDGNPFYLQIGDPWTDTANSGSAYIQEVYNHTY